MREVANQQQGLYRPEFEHDNCGIGAVVNIKGKKTHDTVANALKIEENLEHPAGKDEEGKIRPYHLGHFFIAIDTEAFMGAEAFKKTCGDILRDLRGSEKAPGQERIYTAGEKEYDVWMYRKDKGVPVTEAVQKEFIGLRNEFGLTQFKFPFEK